MIAFVIFTMGNTKTHRTMGSPLGTTKNNRMGYVYRYGAVLRLRYVRGTFLLRGNKTQRCTHSQSTQRISVVYIIVKRSTRNMAFRIASLLYFWWGLVSNGVSLVASVRVQPRLSHARDPLRYEKESHNEVLFDYRYYATDNETNSTDAPTDTNSTMAPTASPDNSTKTMAPTPFNSTNHTLTPTAAPTSGSNRTSTEAPATTAPQPNTPPAPPAPVNPPYTLPTSAPSAADHNHNKQERPHVSFLRIIGKGIAWMILLFLGTLAFGGFMQHRYRIYYFARGCYYTLLRRGCTQWILSKLRFNRGGAGGFVDNSLNTIIFDNEMTEGLLMQENND